MAKINVNELLTKGISNIIPKRKTLAKILGSDKKLNIYLGIDPTATKIHLGNVVALRKLQIFAELGHNVTFLIGDFTALIGDSSDKEAERPILTSSQIKSNFKTYKKQASKFIDFSKVKIRHNSKWLDKLTFKDIVKLAQNFSLGDFISRELIKKRLNAGKRVRLDEAIYPLMQGYDSYYMDTDIQIGGADQTFNMQAGRALQIKLRKKESFILVTDYLEGTDGRKMSKSWGNAIWVEDEPNDMFGKVMSIRDDLIINYFTLATNLSMDRISGEVNLLKDGENPMTIKRRLAQQIVKEIYGDAMAQLAMEKFDKTFSKKKPSYSEKVKYKPNLISLVASASGASVSQSKILLEQNAVDINGSTVSDPNYKLKGGEKIRIGKKKFVTVNKK